MQKKKKKTFFESIILIIIIFLLGTFVFVMRYIGETMKCRKFVFCFLLLFIFIILYDIKSKEELCCNARDSSEMADVQRIYGFGSYFLKGWWEAWGTYSKVHTTWRGLVSCHLFALYTCSALCITGIPNYFIAEFH